MNFGKIGVWLLLMTTCYFNSAQAAVIGIDQTPSIVVNLGNEVNSTLSIDFPANEESTGGTFVIQYDSTVLSNPVINFESNLLSSFGITDAFFNVSNGAVKVTFGALALNTGVVGAGALAHLTFDSIATGISMLALEDADGGFRGLSNNVQTINYVGTQVQVVTPIPLPSAIWLFVSSLGVYISYRKKRGAIT